VAELAGNKQRFKEKNADLAVIGSGDPAHFKEFREKTGYDGLLFSDPSLAAFSLLGFAGGIGGVMSIHAVFKAVSAFRQGHRQGSVQGSALQLGGAIVIDVSGAVRYFYASAKAGDHPAVDALIRAVDKDSRLPSDSVR
jgi:peroxiredoxin